MITSKPNVDPEGLYTARKAAEALGISNTTIRKYARLGLIEMHIHKATGRQVYKGADIIKCWREVYL